MIASHWRAFSSARLVFNSSSSALSAARLEPRSVLIVDPESLAKPAIADVEFANLESDDHVNSEVLPNLSYFSPIILDSPNLVDIQSSEGVANCAAYITSEAVLRG